MASALPDFPPFDINTDPTSVGITWKKWIQRFDDFLVALDVDDGNRKKALLLYYGGKELHDIYDTISSVKDEYNDIKRKLTNYFEPKINLTFEVYNFRQMKQEQGESIDQFVTRLKQKAQRCNFYDNDREIKDQVVFNCYSDRLRRKALRDDLDLPNLVAAARAIELSNKQAALIEAKDQEDINHLKKPGKYSNKFKLFKKQ